MCVCVCVGGGGGGGGGGGERFTLHQSIHVQLKNTYFVI